MSKLLTACIVVLAAIALNSEAFAQESMPMSPSPKLDRIRIATIGALSVSRTEDLYTTYLGQKVRERGNVSRAMADSWGTPNSVGRPYILMSTDAHPDVYIRAVEVDAVPGYRALTTWGWNAIEVIIDDINALHTRLKASPFEFIGEPASLGVRYPTIYAMQVKGPSEEVLYLTTETGDRSKSSLPLPGALIGRPFIMVVAGPNISAMRDWYADAFSMARQPINPSLASLSRRAQGLDDGAEFTISLLSLKQHGNMIQMDGYPASTKARPHAQGQLPPGVAMTSFEVSNLKALSTSTIKAPKVLNGKAYNGAPSATVVGFAGELIELIESAPSVK